MPELFQKKIKFLILPYLLFNIVNLYGQEITYAPFIDEIITDNQELNKSNNQPVITVTHLTNDSIEVIISSSKSNTTTGWIATDPNCPAPNNIFQRVKIDTLLINMSLKAKLVKQENDKNYYSSIEADGSIHFKGTANEYCPDNETYNFDATRNYLIIDGPGTIVYSNSINRVIGIDMNFNPGSAYPQMYKLLHSYGAVDTLAIRADLPSNWVFNYPYDLYQVYPAEVLQLAVEFGPNNKRGTNEPGNSRDLTFKVSLVYNESPSVEYTVSPKVIDKKNSDYLTINPSSQTVIGKGQTDYFYFEIPQNTNEFDGDVVIDVKDNSNKKISTTIPFKYYVSDFEWGKDNYSFENESNVVPHILEQATNIFLKKIKHLEILIALKVLIVKYLLSQEGLCYGFSNTSIQYKEKTNEWPAPNYTFNLKWDDNRVRDSIIVGHIKQKIPNPSLVFNPRPQSNSDVLLQKNKIINSLLQNKSMNMRLINNGHAVHTYSALDLNDSCIFYYYDPNWTQKSYNWIVIRGLNTSSPHFFYKEEVVPGHPTEAFEQEIVLFERPEDLDYLCINKEPENNLNDSTYYYELLSDFFKLMHEEKRQYLIFWDSTSISDTINSVNILIRNSASKRIGFINGQQINEAANSYIFDAENYKIFELPAEDIYSIEVKELNPGYFTPSLVKLNSDSSISLINFPDIVMPENSIATAIVPQNISQIIFSVDRDGDGITDITINPTYDSVVTDVSEFEQVIPNSFDIISIYPNPFNPTTTISYSLPTESKVKIEIYDILGRLIEKLVDAEETAGKKQIVWNASNVCSGVYILRLIAEPRGNNFKRFVSTKKIILLR
jgi:hypothetical protein